MYDNYWIADDPSVSDLKLQVESSRNKAVEIGRYIKPPGCEPQEQLISADTAPDFAMNLNDRFSSRLSLIHEKIAV
jgi:hypothetical protein